MRSIAFAFLFFVAVWPRLNAEECPDTARYKDAREIIQHLERIVVPSGIQESYKTKIGGIDQWINVRGQDRSNPIILFIHGGPASPLTPTIWQFQRPIEEYFTVVNWDQRGAGKTYREANPDSISDTIHISRYVDDAIEVVDYIRNRYHKDKLILIGHSWGTVVGMNVALKRPDLFFAYVGIGQVINTRDNEGLSFDYAIKQARDHRNSSAVKELESIAPYPGNKPITRERINTARKWAQFYGGMSAYRETSKYYFNAPLLSPEYTADEIGAIDKGSLFTLGRILPELLEVNFNNIRSFPIPVVMFMGRHDYTTPSEPTSAWLNKVKAPYKQGVFFEHSAHMIPWEEPGKTLVSLLKYVRPLAVNTNDTDG
jgi:pimeloyl-ACP methyl ester carboxylesterase